MNRNPPAPEEKPNTERMELRNGDTIAGEVVSIVDGMITVKTPFREVKLPVGAASLGRLETGRSRTLQARERRRPRLVPGRIVASSSASMPWTMRTLTGFSQNFGTATFKIAAFNRIEFNIYDPAFKDIRVANGW